MTGGCGGNAAGRSGAGWWRTGANRETEICQKAGQTGETDPI